MKHLIILSLLMTASSQAQEDQLQNQVQNEAPAKAQKRPSWSQGLPERQSSINPRTSMQSMKSNKKPLTAIEDDRSLEATRLPVVEIDMVSSQPIVELEIEPAQVAAPTREEAFEQYYSTLDNVVADTKANPLNSQYKWKLLKTIPIEVPDNFDDNTALKLNIHINPKGEVTRVTVAEANIPSRVFKSAEKSILKWKFEAPAEIGITDNISKTFTIDIETDA